MYFDPYLIQRLAEERAKDLLREAKQERLIRAAKGPRKARRGWWLPVALMLSSLLGLVIRLQS